ncbi:hypothetical protein ECDEC1E_0937 [Escherichia coli DEC1E]|nr:hypothetical protein ECDEC1E_0937 [Escherichia coli DEC1E]
MHNALSDESYILKCEYFDPIFFNCRLESPENRHSIMFSF